MTSALVARVGEQERLVRYGRIQRVVGLVIEATGLDVGLGELCRIRPLGRELGTLAEVVGFNGPTTLLMPLGELEGIRPGSPVEALGRSFGVDVGPGLLGRILDGLGHPIDGKGPLGHTVRVPLTADPPDPLDRPPIDTPITTGVRAIDGMISVGRGQRMGIFAGSGVGKSTLLGMIARNASADVNVIALLGERGREVRDFIEESLGPEGLARSVLVVATGDRSALMRARGALVATSIAEYFRDQGKHVLLMLDSVTRVAMAWREIGLAVGEPPTTRGYPPSVFAALPRLLERAGAGRTGAITAMYTVLVEGDDFNEPVTDHVRSVLDGHIVLSRRLATAGHFPAIDVLESASRVRNRIADVDQLAAARTVQEQLAIYREKEDLIAVGAYREGTSPVIDRAVRMRDPINRFLQQGPGEPSTFDSARSNMLDLAGEARK